MLATQMKNVHVAYGKPVYMGFTVLELPINKIFSFHYDYIKPKSCGNIYFMHMNTDILIYD